MNKLGKYLESAFVRMKMSYRKIENPEQIVYRIDFPESGIFCSTVTLVIDKMFCSEISSYIARGITENKRYCVLEEMNKINDEVRLISVCMDENNDVYSYHQFILAGDEHMMCKQIIMNLVVFYDLHKRTAEKIYRLIS